MRVVVAVGVGLTVVTLVLLGPWGDMALVLALVVAAVNYTKTPTDRRKHQYTHQRPTDAGRGVAPTARAATANEPAIPVAGLSDEQLCWAWRRSFAQLQRTTDSEDLARLAIQRQNYLDELERRYPARFAAWISSGARASGDPHPYIRGRRNP